MSCEQYNRYDKNTPAEEWTQASPSTLNEILNCTGICGPNHYIDLDNSISPPSAECKACPTNIPAEYEDQCSSISDIWFPSQKNVNYGTLQRDTSRSNWTDIVFDETHINETNCSLFISNQITGLLDESDLISGCEILNYYRDSVLPLFNEQLIEIFGNPVGTNDDGSFRYQLGSEYSGTTQEERILDLRNKIHENRGSRIPINSEILRQWNANWQRMFTPREQPVPGGPEDIMGEGLTPGTGYTLSDLDISQTGNYTNKHIILQEVYDYEQSLTRNTQNNPLDGFNFQQLFSGAASSSEFESCMNSILESNVASKTYCNGKTNLEIQEEIARSSSILDLENCHIDYIEDKLKIISTIRLTDAKECMDILNIAEMFSCEEPISTKMIQIATLIFHIIGLDNLDLSTIQQGSPDYYHLSRIIDRLTPYIKQSIKRIIEISKHYEEETCGRESTTTHMLERIYIDLFDKSSEISIDFNGFDFIPNYIIKGTTFTEFTKLIVSLSFLIMVFLSFAFFIKMMGGNNN